MTTETIPLTEKLAREIVPHAFCIGSGVSQREWAIGKARAVLQTLHDNITPEMGLAGAEQVNKQMRGPGAKADYFAAKDSFQAMIAEALSQSTALKGERA